MRKAAARQSTVAGYEDLQGKLAEAQAALSLLDATSAPSYNLTYNAPGRGVVHLSASPGIVTCSSLAAATAQFERILAMEPVLFSESVVECHGY